MGEEIPLETEMNRKTFGFVVKDNNIIGLGLYNRRLPSLPESIKSLSKLTYLYLRKNQLTSFEFSREFSKLTHFDISSNQLKSIPDSISQLHNLRVLILDSNQLRAIPSSIGQLVNLEELKIRNNQLSSIPNDLKKLRLQSLDLSQNPLIINHETSGEWLIELEKNGCEIYGISERDKVLLKLHQTDRKVIDDLKEIVGDIPVIKDKGRFGFIAENDHIVEIRLIKKFLSSIPECLKRLSYLRTLNIANNRITSLTEKIGEMPQLNELNLSSNALTTLPEAIGQLKQLRSLDIRSNKLTTLPETIGQLKQLRSLDIRGNLLTILPESIGQLKSLQQLYLSSNKLKKLPNSIGELSQLTILGIRGNDLTSLPNTIGQLTPLKELYISQNYNLTLPEALGQLVHLKKIDITRDVQSFNKFALGSLPLNLWHWLSELEKKGCEIRGVDLERLKVLINLPEQEISALKDLETLIGEIRLSRSSSKISWSSFGLVVKGNHITGIGFYGHKLPYLPNSIGQLTHLQELSLSNQDLELLPDSIGCLINLRIFILSSNRLKALPDSIRHLTKLQYLSLSGNKFTSFPESIGLFKQLTELALSGSSLKTLPKSLDQLTNLKKLFLPKDGHKLLSLNLMHWLVELEQKGCQISGISTVKYEKYLNLPSEEIIFLRDLEKIVGEIPLVEKRKTESFFFSIKNNHITVLWLYDKNLNTLPESIEKLNHLQELNLQRNMLTELPKGLLKLKNIKKLDLAYNRITILPEDLEQLKNLRELSLYSNQLTTLPKNIGFLENLERLDLSNNQLAIIPKSIGGLRSLEYISFQNNPLKALPESLMNLGSLCKFNLREISIYTFSEAILQWLLKSESKDIVLHNYSFEEVQILSNLPEAEKDVLFKLERLLGKKISLKSERNFHISRPSVIGLENGHIVELNLVWRHSRYRPPGRPLTFAEKITDFPIEIAQLTDLRKLNLSNNDITSIPYEVGQLKKLEELNLANNPIKSLSENITKLVHLKKLDLTEHNLYYVSEEIIKWMEALEKQNCTLTPFKSLKRLKELSRLPMDELTFLQELEANLKGEIPIIQNSSIEEGKYGISIIDRHITGLGLGENYYSIPETITFLKKLTHLNLEQSSIRTLPEGIVKLKNLEYLNLKNSNILKEENIISEEVKLWLTRLSEKGCNIDDQTRMKFFLDPEPIFGSLLKLAKEYYKGEIEYHDSDRVDYIFSFVQSYAKYITNNLDDLYSENPKSLSLITPFLILDESICAKLFSLLRNKNNIDDDFFEHCFWIDSMSGYRNFDLYATLRDFFDISTKEGAKRWKNVLLRAINSIDDPYNSQPIVALQELIGIHIDVDKEITEYLNSYFKVKWFTSAWKNINSSEIHSCYHERRHFLECAFGYESTCVICDALLRSREDANIFYCDHCQGFQCCNYTIMKHEDGREELKCGIGYKKIYEYLDSLDLEDYADTDMYKWLPRDYRDFLRLEKINDHAVELFGLANPSIKSFTVIRRYEDKYRDYMYGGYDKNFQSRWQIYLWKRRKRGKELILSGVKKDGTAFQKDFTSSIRKIEIKKTDLEELDLSSVIYCKFLKKIVISNNPHLRKITLIPINDLNHLKTIDFSNNQLSDIDLSSLRGSSSVVMINLSGNQIECLDLSLFRHSKDSDQMNLDDRKGGFRNLKYLYLVRNKINEIDLSPLANCPFLTELALSYNNLANLSKINLSKLHSCVNLKKLWLSGNNIREIDFTYLLPFKKLKTLALSHNNLTNIDFSVLKEFEDLEELFLSNNHLTTINLEDIQLLNLDLSSNKISRIDLTKLNKITNLKLSNNQLTSISLNAFNFKSLNFSNNKIKRIDFESADRLSSLEELNLNGNNLTSFDAELILVNKQLKRLSLNNNPIDNLNLEPLQKSNFSLKKLDTKGIERVIYPKISPYLNVGDKITELFYEILEKEDIEIIRKDSKSFYREKYEQKYSQTHVDEQSLGKDDLSFDDIAYWHDTGRGGGEFYEQEFITNDYFIIHKITDKTIQLYRDGEWRYQE